MHWFQGSTWFLPFVLFVLHSSWHNWHRDRLGMMLNLSFVLFDFLLPIVAGSASNLMRRNLLLFLFLEERPHMNLTLVWFKVFQQRTTAFHGQWRSLVWGVLRLMLTQHRNFLVQIACRPSMMLLLRVLLLRFFTIWTVLLFSRFRQRIGCLFARAIRLRTMVVGASGRPSTALLSAWD